MDLNDLDFEYGSTTSMNQNINIVQVKKLDINQLNKLVPKLAIIYEPEILHKISECCTIGIMIEILCNSDFCFPSIGLTEPKTRHEYIVVGVTCLSGTKEFYGRTFEGEDLVDALWNAVISTLYDLKKPIEVKFGRL